MSHRLMNQWVKVKNSFSFFSQHHRGRVFRLSFGVFLKQTRQKKPQRISRLLKNMHTKLTLEKNKKGQFVNLNLLKSIYTAMA